MISNSTARSALSRIAAVTLAAGLAGLAGSAHASAVASVAITGFTISTSADPSVFVFAATDYQSQTWDLRAQSVGFGLVQRNGSLTNWANVDQTAPGALASATVSSSVFTDNATQLNTPGFTLGATATPSGNPPSNPNRGSGSFDSAGLFCFGDGVGFDGTSGGCDAAGQLTVTVYYDLLATVSDAGQLAESTFGLHIANSDGSLGTTLSDFASSATGGSLTGRSQTFTLNLAAGDVAFVDIGGSVLATAIPEPQTLGLAALGLLGMGLTRRRYSAPTAQA